MFKNVKFKIIIILQIRSRSFESLGVSSSAILNVSNLQKV